MEDNVEILDQEELEKEVLGQKVKKVKIRVRHLDFKESEGWIDASEVVYIRDWCHGKTTRQEQIVTVQELAISNMLEIETLRQLLFEKGIITAEEFLANIKKLDREMKEKRER